MKKIAAVILMFVLISTGCNKTIKPIKITKTDFNIYEAESIMKRAWQPVYEMTNANHETRPDIPISSKEEFFELYDFSFMDERYVAHSIFESIVSFHDNKEVKDDKGNIVFGEGNFATYIPTIYDEGIFIRNAYLRDSRYKEEYSDFDIVELVVEEYSDDKVNQYVSGFSRKNVFRQNEDGEWILYSFEGTLSIGWER